MPAATGIKRVGLAVASLLGAGLALLLILSLVIPADTVRDAVKAQIRAVTGLDPVLRGDVSVSLFPTGSVRFNDVSLGDNRTGAPALSAEQLLVRLRFFPFLIGRIEIADVTLVRPTITIAFAADGSSNWAGHIETLARALTPSPDRVKSFSEIRISDGTAIIRDEAYRIVETLTNVEFALAWPSISRTFAATGRFTWNEQPFDGNAEPHRFPRGADRRALRPQGPAHRRAAQVRVRRQHQPPADAADRRRAGGRHQLAARHAALGHRPVVVGRRRSSASRSRRRPTWSAATSRSRRSTSSSTAIPAKAC